MRRAAQPVDPRLDRAAFQPQSSWCRRTMVFHRFQTMWGSHSTRTHPLASESAAGGGQASLTLTRIRRMDGRLEFQPPAFEHLHQVRAPESPTTVRIDDAVNPFATDLPGLFTVRTDRFSSRSATTLSQITANGPIAKLPAGPVQATVEGRAAWNRVHSNSQFAGIDNRRDFHRSEQAIRGAIDIPIDQPRGRVSCRAGRARRQYRIWTERIIRTPERSAIMAMSINWEPRPFLRLTGSIEGTDAGASRTDSAVR